MASPPGRGRPTRQPGDLEAGADALVQVLDGPGADAILMMVGICECDLIVMGSRSYGALVSLILGSVSRRAFTSFRGPVLIVKARRE